MRVLLTNKKIFDDLKSKLFDSELVQALTVVIYILLRAIKLD